MFNKQYNNIIDKLCVRLLHIKKKNRKVFIVLSGAQGSGKNTLTRNLKYKLAKNYKVLSLSIDDFYLSKRDREILIYAQKDSEPGRKKFYWVNPNINNVNPKRAHF